MTSSQAYRTVAIVGADHRIEIVAPQLSEGERVEVILLPPSGARSRNAPSVLDFLLSPDRPVKDAAYWEEREKEIREIRDSWDR